MSAMCVCGHNQGRHAGPMVPDGNHPCCGTRSMVSHSDCTCRDFVIDEPLENVITGLQAIELDLR